MHRRLWKVAFAVAIAAGPGRWSLRSVWARAQLRGSLPVLDGTTLRLEGLSAPVIVTRDALGIPTVRGASREDVARATGFLHAQDRFFQMDLARRRAAGELSALVGPRALVADRQIRMHRFRAEAQRAVAADDAGDGAPCSTPTRGRQHRPEPRFELRRSSTWCCGRQPQPWLAEDSLLVVLSMFITLQDPDGAYEATLGDDARRAAGGDGELPRADRDRVGFADRRRAPSTCRRSRARTSTTCGRGGRASVDDSRGRLELPSSDVRSPDRARGARRERWRRQSGDGVGGRLGTELGVGS